jgi:hypothetical protein
MNMSKEYCFLQEEGAEICYGNSRFIRPYYPTKVPCITT